MSSLVLARRFLHRRISPWRRGALTQADVAGDPPEFCVRIAINSDPRCRGRAKTIHVFSRDDNWQKNIIFPYRGGRGKLSFILISVSGNGLAKRAHRLLYSGTSSIDKCTCLVNASCVCVCVSDRLRARARTIIISLEIPAGERMTTCEMSTRLRERLGVERILFQNIFKKKSISER